MSIGPLDEREVRYRVSRISELPPLPKSLERLIEIIHDEIDSSNELQSIIGYDQSLTAKILQVANSTYFGCRGKVKTLSKALTLIGLNRAKAVCLCTLLMNVLSNGAAISAAERESLWKHAFATSRIAAEISKRRPWMDLEEASILGLLHDIGYIVMAVYFNDRFRETMALALRRKIPAWCVEMQTGFDHTQLGKYLASRWAFPELLQAVIEHHHAPDRSKSHRTEVKLIYLANVLSNSREYPELLADEATLAYCRDLFISEEEWQEYQESLGLIWPEVDQLWDLLG